MVRAISDGLSNFEWSDHLVPPMSDRVKENIKLCNFSLVSVQ